MRPLTGKEIRVDEDVVEEMDRLRKKGFDLRLNYPHLYPLPNNKIRIVFHNVRSLLAHFPIIKSSVFYQNCHLLVFCETWLNDGDDITKFNLPGYKGTFYNFPISGQSRRERAGMVVYVSNQIQASMQCVVINAIQLVKITVDTTRILAVHRRSRLTTESLLTNTLTCVLKSFPADVVLGDMNVDPTNTNSSITSSMVKAGYNRLSDGFTTVEFTEIDLAFAKSHGSLRVLETAFSDHMPIMVEY